MTDFECGAFIILCGCFVLYMLFNERRAQKTRDALLSYDATFEATLASCDRVGDLFKKLEQKSGIEWKKLDDRIKNVDKKADKYEYTPKEYAANVWDQLKEHIGAEDFMATIKNAVDVLNARVDEETKKLGETAEKLDEHIDNNKGVGDLRALEKICERLITRVTRLESRNNLQDAALNTWREPEVKTEYNG